MWRYSHYPDLQRHGDTVEGLRSGTGDLMPMPRDIQAPIRRRHNRVTLKEITRPEVILISCTEGKDLKAQIEDFNKTGMGPHYVIGKNGQRVQLVEAWLSLGVVFI